MKINLTKIASGLFLVAGIVGHTLYLIKEKLTKKRKK